MQPPRRRKTQLACSRCRDRKTRCDGRRPFCMPCETRGWRDQCSYESVSLRPHSSVYDIESRLRRLEQSQSSGVNPENQNSFRQNISPPYFEPSNSSWIGDSQEQEQASSGEVIGMHAEEDHVPNAPSDEADRFFYGASSNVSFIHQVDKISKSADNSQRRSLNKGIDDEQRSATFLGQPQSSELPKSWGTSVGILPERHIADCLMDCFWEHIHPIFPIVHRPSHLRLYQQLWNPRQAKEINNCIHGVGRAVLYSTLNIMFALGCQFYDKISPEERITLADQFYQRSLQLVSIELLDTSSLPIVQMLLLTGIYLHSTRYANRCWNVIGSALRVAQGLGIHLERSNTYNESQLKREMRRRVWYNCVMLDKLTATTFGRPTLLSKRWEVKLPEPIDDEALQETGEGCQQPNVPARMECFVYSIKLFDILDDVLSTFYSHCNENYGRSPQSHLDNPSSQHFLNALALNSRLDDFLTDLPGHLKMGNHSTTYDVPLEKCFQLQARTLYCRSLYIRILLIRPWLLAGIQTGVETVQRPEAPHTSGLEQSAINEMKRLCISTAQMIIETLHDHLETPYKSSSWHTVYFTFAAATVLSAAALYPQSGVNLELNPYKSSWEKAIKILDYNRVQLQSSFRGIEILEACRSRISVIKERGTRIDDEAVQESGGLHSEPTLELESDWTASVDMNSFDLANFDLFAEPGFFTQEPDIDDWQ